LKRIFLKNFEKIKPLTNEEKQLFIQDIFEKCYEFSGVNKIKDSFIPPMPKLVLG